jgi:hypothetical protein
MDEMDPEQTSRSQRTRVLLKATLDTPEGSIHVLLRDLSQDGALVTGERLPAKGQRVLFHRQGLAVPSHVAWVRKNECGIEFDFPLFPKELLRHEPPKDHPSSMSPAPWLFGASAQ